MKTSPWQSFVIALAFLPAVALASKIPDSSKTPDKSVSLPREVRSPSTVEMLRALAGEDEAHCATVEVSAPIKFHGRTLIEIPDITEPALRQANQLMSAGCFETAVDRLDAVLRKDPRNRNAKYVIARMSWMRMGVSDALRVLTRTLSEHPDFISAKVLLAGIHYSQRNLPEVVRLLDEAEPKSPTDLWIYMNRLRLEVTNSPSRDLRARLLEIARSPAFPPNAREEAADIAKYVPNQSDKDFEEVLQAGFAIDSYLGLPCKAADYASWLGSGRDRFADVIKLLESPRAKEGNCTSIEINRTLLAHAYLMEAAKINSRGPNPANQHLVDRADKIVGGDYTHLAEFAMSRTDAGAVYPFIKAHVKQSDAYIRTEAQLCSAIQQLDVEAVVAALDAGANPNGKCKGRTMVGALVFTGTTAKDEERQAILRNVIEYGGEPTHIAECRKPAAGDCSEVLLPTLEGYARLMKRPVP